VLRYDGATWSKQDVASTGAFLLDVWSSSPDDVYVVGAHGTLLHYDGLAWTALESGTDTFLRGVSGTDANDVYVAGDGIVLHFDGNAWTSGPSESWESVWALDAANVFAVTLNQIARVDGTASTILYKAPMLSVGFVSYHDLWASAASDLWAVGSAGAITHYDGTSFDTRTDVPRGIYSVWGSSPADVVAAGEPMVLRYRCH
jgi:hypothetical protein